MTKKTIMINAWKIARNGVKRFGGKATDYIASAMKISWNMYKALKAKKGDITRIAPWFLEKTFGHKSMVQQINGDSTLKIKKATDKAFLIVATAFQSGIEVVNEFWAPKSVCV